MEPSDDFFMFTRGWAQMKAAYGGISNSHKIKTGWAQMKSAYGGTSPTPYTRHANGLRSSRRLWRAIDVLLLEGTPFAFLV